MPAESVHQRHVSDVADDDRRDPGEYLGEDPGDRREARRRELREVEAGQDADGAGDHKHAEAQEQRAEDRVLETELVAGRCLGEQARLEHGKRVRKDADDDVDRGRDDQKEREAAETPEESGANVTPARPRHHGPPEAHPPRRDAPRDALRGW